MDHTDWLLDRIKNEKGVSMPAFSTHFDFNDESDTHKAYSKLISSTEIPQSTRISLQDSYTMWQKNYGQEYWSLKSASLQVRVSTNKTAEQLSIGGEYVIKKLVQENITVATVR
ncbi:hypothetical protein BGZ76_004974, partial [Entomortierella beljakovae]